MAEKNTSKLSDIDVEPSHLLTIKEASRLINVHPNTLRNWEREGKIQAFRIGSRRDRRYSKKAIRQLFRPVQVMV